MSTVLVTGGTSFIAGHCIRMLLERGYNVVTTVRSDSKGQQVLKAHNAGDRLRYHIVEDIAQPGAFDDVVQSTNSLKYVLHTASPFHFNVQDPVKDFLEPAISGSTGILKAVHQFAPSVSRVVLTSSIAAMRNDGEVAPHYDESSWNRITWDEAASNTKKTYHGSKALAEKAAWDFVKTEHPNFDLVAINPSLVFGPVAPHLTKGELSSLNTSNLRILDMIQGKMKDKLAPTGFYTWVDVRDVALAHIKALEVAEAGGKRFFLIEGYHTNKAIAKIVGNISPELEEKLPKDIEGQEDDFPREEERYTFDNSQSKKVLEISYTSLEKSVTDTVESLLALGA